MNTALNIALLQIAPCGDCDENEKKGVKACRAAAERGAHIALFPEMYSCGYGISRRPPAEWEGMSVPADGRFASVFSSLAHSLNMAVGITILEKRQGPPANTLLLFDCEGRLALKYSKVHTCDFGFERALSRGDGFPVCNLKTAAGEVAVGAMICFDREFPESARVLMLNGAEVILVPNACPMEVNRLSQLRARAFENMVCVATCNYPSGVADCNGRSSVYDGMAWREEGDMNILLAGGEEGIYIASVDISALRAYRSGEVLGNAYRRPALYSALSACSVKPPFVRRDAR